MFLLYFLSAIIAYFLVRILPNILLEVLGDSVQNILLIFIVSLHQEMIDYTFLTKIVLSSHNNSYIFFIDIYVCKVKD